MRRTLPNRCPCVTYKTRLGNRTVFFTVDFGFEREPLGVTLRTMKAGTELRRTMGGIGHLASNALQHGVPVDDVKQNLTDIAPGYGEAFGIAIIPERIEELDKDPDVVE